MTYAQFARQLRPLVETLGAVRAAELCGVSERTIRLWLRAEARPALCTMRGALDILRDNQPAKVGAWSSFAAYSGARERAICLRTSAADGAGQATQAKTIALVGVST